MKILIEDSVLRQWKEALLDVRDFKPNDVCNAAISSMQSHLDAAEKVEPVAWLRRDRELIDVFTEEEREYVKGMLEPLYLHPATAVPEGYKLVAISEINELYDQMIALRDDVRRLVSKAPTPPTNTNRNQAEPSSGGDGFAAPMERGCLPNSLSIINEAALITCAYDRIRAERTFAIDDLEYDLFAAGWKACAELATNTDSELRERLNECEKESDEWEGRYYAIDVELGKLREAARAVVNAWDQDTVWGDVIDRLRKAL